MTDDERHEAALSDPDNQPRMPGDVSHARPVAEIKRLRWSMGLSQAEFARRFHIPVETLRDWEQHRTEPDPTTCAYLKVIRHMPNKVVTALGSK